MMNTTPRILLFGYKADITILEQCSTAAMLPLKNASSHVLTNDVDSIFSDQGKSEIIEIVSGIHSEKDIVIFASIKLFPRLIEFISALVVGEFRKPRRIPTVVKEWPDWVKYLHDKFSIEIDADVILRSYPPKNRGDSNMKDMNTALKYWCDKNNNIDGVIIFTPHGVLFECLEGHGGNIDSAGFIDIIAAWSQMVTTISNSLSYGNSRYASIPLEKGSVIIYQADIEGTECSVAFFGFYTSKKYTPVDVTKQLINSEKAMYKGAERIRSLVDLIKEALQG